MGVLAGYRQVSLYVDPAVYDRATHVAGMLDIPMYKFVNQALTLMIEHNTTPEQRKALDLLVGTPSTKKTTKKKPTKRAR